MAQVEKDPELQDPEMRAELDRRAREGETVVKGGTRGKSLEAEERLAEARKKGGLSTEEESGHERASREGFKIEVDRSKLQGD